MTTHRFAMAVSAPRSSRAETDQAASRRPRRIWTAASVPFWEQEGSRRPTETQSGRPCMGLAKNFKISKEDETKRRLDHSFPRGAPVSAGGGDYAQIT